MDGRRAQRFFASRGGRRGAGGLVSLRNLATWSRFPALADAAAGPLPLPDATARETLTRGYAWVWRPSI
jgi:hypothetical protein